MFQGSKELEGNRWAWEQGGLGDNLASVKLPAGWLEKPREFGREPLGFVPLGRS